MKTLTIPTPYHSFLEDCSYSDLVNGYFGGSNLLAAYLNDFSSKAINRRIAEFLEEAASTIGADAVEDLLNNPDTLVQEAASELCSALAVILDDAEQAERCLRHASTHFEPWGTYYVFANADIACSYIIRADNEPEAYEWLVTEFEIAFAVEEEDAAEDTPRNDNGTPINTDYLVMLGSVKFVKPEKKVVP